MKRHKHAADAEDHVYLVPHGVREDSRVGDPKHTKEGLAQVRAAIVVLVETMDHEGIGSVLLVVPEHGARFLEMEVIFRQEANKRHIEIKRLVTPIVGNSYCFDWNGHFYGPKGEKSPEDEFLSPTKLIAPTKDHENRPWQFVREHFLSRGKDAVVVLSGGPFIKLFGRKEQPVCGQKAFRLDFQYKRLDPLPGSDVVIPNPTSKLDKQSGP